MPSYRRVLKIWFHWLSLYPYFLVSLVRSSNFEHTTGSLETASAPARSLLPKSTLLAIMIESWDLGWWEMLGASVENIDWHQIDLVKDVGVPGVVEGGLKVGMKFGLAFWASWKVGHKSLGWRSFSGAGVAMTYGRSGMGTNGSVQSFWRVRGVCRWWEEYSRPASLITLRSSSVWVEVLGREVGQCLEQFVWLRWEHGVLNCFSNWNLELELAVDFQCTLQFFLSRRQLF